jgi:hypothetical protein
MGAVLARSALLMPFPRPEGPSEPIKVGEWGCIALFVVLSAYWLTVAIFT